MSRFERKTDLLESSIFGLNQKVKELEQLQTVKGHMDDDRKKLDRERNSLKDRLSQWYQYFWDDVIVSFVVQYAANVAAAKTPAVGV